MAPISGKLTLALLGLTVSAVSAYTCQSLGCYSDSGARTLNGASDGTNGDSTMTIEKCEAFCTGYTYYGLEYAHECWCGNTIDNNGAPIDAGNCNQQCDGDSSENCGGGYALNLFYCPAAATTTATPIDSATVTSTETDSTTITSTETDSASPTTSLTTTTSTTLKTTTSTPPAPPSAKKQGCNQGNCLRNLEDKRYSAKASAFCSTYTTSVVTDPSAIPSYLKNCRSLPSKVSSACSCLMQPTPL